MLSPTTYNGLVATLGQGADVISFGTAANFVNTSILGGEDNDTLTFGGTLNSTTFGTNEGADRIYLGSATLISSTIGAGKGHDIITTTALAAGSLVATNGTVTGGEGLDSINISLGAASTTTNLLVFGDVSDSGDSTLGAADFINFSANGLTEFGSSSVYGGIGSDTITFGGITAGRGTAIAIRAFGNAGDDAITFGAGASSSLIGGAGNDTLIGQFALTAGGLASGFNLNGGTGVDRLIFANNTAAYFTASTALGVFGNSVIGSFTDSGDNILLQGVGNNAATYSAVNFLNTGAQVVAGAANGGTATTFSGAFVYNLTGGFTTAQVDGIALSAGFKVGDMNIYEANGDTVVQILFAQTGAGIGAVLTAGNSAGFLTFNLSGNLGVIDNGTAGYISKTGVNLTFGIASDATLGRNGFTITVV